MKNTRPVAVPASTTFECGSATVELAASNGRGSAQLVGEHLQRRSITIHNTGAATCYIASDPDRGTAGSFELDAGASLTLDTTAAVFVIAGTATTTLTWVSEYGWADALRYEPAPIVVHVKCPGGCE